MKNPKTFMATPWGHKGLNDKSGPDKNLSAHGRPTMVKATGMDHFQPTPKSGEGYKSLGHKGMAMGMPYAKASDRSEMPVSGMAMPKPNMKSMPDVPSEPKKWHRSGRYDMNPNPAGSMPMKKK